MARKKRRSPRIDISIPVRIIIHNKGTNRTLAETTGRISDISRHGVRLIVTQAKIERWHIFYSFHDSDQQVISLEILPLQDQDQQEDVPDFQLPVKPVWFDRLLSQPDKPFQLGMAYRRELPPEIVEWLKGLQAKLHSQRKTSWWSRLFGGSW